MAAILTEIGDLIHEAIFVVALAYARKFPKLVRRVFEFITLIAAISGFFVLVYMHIAFSKTPATCLEHVRKTWPRDGILRIEIIRNVSEDYTLEESYAKEEKIQEEKVEYLSIALKLLDLNGFFTTESIVADREIYPAWFENAYIFEYSFEHGLLPLSPATRTRLKIPVQIVTLDPDKDECFGNAFSRLVLDEIVGYGDLLIASVKTFTDQENNKGYLRSGKQYYRISMFKERISYFAAFAIIILCVSY